MHVRKSERRPYAAAFVYACCHPGFGLPALVRNALNKAYLDLEWLVGWPALQETVVKAIASPANAEESTDAVEKASDHGDAGAEGTATGVCRIKACRR